MESNKQTVFGSVGIMETGLTRKVLGVGVGMVLLFSGIGVPVAVAGGKMSSEVVQAKLDAACVRLSGAAKGFGEPSDRASYAKFFRIANLTFVRYASAVKLITPANTAEKVAISNLYRYATRLAAELRKASVLFSSKKTEAAGTLLMSSVPAVFGPVSSQVRESLESAGLADCVDARTGSGPGRVDVDESYFPEIVGYKYGRSDELNDAADQVFEVSKMVYSAVSIRELFDESSKPLGVITAVRFGDLDEGTITRVVNTSAAAVGATASASVNGFAVFIGGVPALDKAIVRRGVQLFEVTMDPSTDRSLITKFVTDFLNKFPPPGV